MSTPQGYLHKITEKPLIGTLKVLEYNASWEERFGTDRDKDVPAPVKELLEHNTADVVYECRRKDHYFCDGSYICYIIWTNQEEVIRQIEKDLQEKSRREGKIHFVYFDEKDDQDLEDILQVFQRSQQLKLPLTI